jgi:AAA domain/Bifunctional DNA primase/polymerase, N-terminal
MTDVADLTAQRKRLLAAGYAPVPANGKAVHITGWSSLQPTEADIEAWAHRRQGDTNTGILTRATPAVDIDVKDPAVADELQHLLFTMTGDNGRALVRIGQAPKRAILFQTSAPFKKSATPAFISPDGNKHQVEVLADGQQIIAFGTHPETGRAYVWHGGEPGEVVRDELPYLDATMAAAFVVKAIEVMKAHGWMADNEKKPQAEQPKDPSDGKNIYSSREQKYAQAALDGCAAELASAVEPGRNNKLNAVAYHMASMTARGWISRDEVEQRLLNAASACKLDNNAARKTLQSGLDAGEAKPHPDLDERATADTKASAEQPPFPLQWLDMSNWDNEPVPERKWAIRDRVPLNQAGLFSGEGGTGKSILELTKNVAHVAGRDWLRSMPEMGPALYIGAEDEADELHRRIAAIASHYRVTFRELIEGGLHVLCLLGQDATLCAASGKSGKIEVTGLYRQLYEAAGDIKPKNISIDTLSRAFAGNEIDRVQVYAFAMHMQALAMVANGSVTVLSHPSLQGIASGSGISGSTAWHGAFRFRQYLRGSRQPTARSPTTICASSSSKRTSMAPAASPSCCATSTACSCPNPESPTSTSSPARPRWMKSSCTGSARSSGRGATPSPGKPVANLARPSLPSCQKRRRSGSVRKT